MFSTIMLVIALICLTGTFFLTAISSAFRRINKGDSQKVLHTLGKTFFYRRFHLFFFPDNEYEGIFFATICAQNIIRFFSSGALLLFVLYQFKIFPMIQPGSTSPDNAIGGWLALTIVAIALFAFLIGDCLPRILGTRFPKGSLKICAPFASLFLVLVFPLTYLFLKVAKLLFRTFYLDLTYEPIAEAHREIIEMIQKADITVSLDAHDKKLIESVMRFKERIAREVMVPRVNVFSLSADTTIKEAAKLLQKEGYSRTPVYKNTVDNIVGVLMYKDI